MISRANLPSAVFLVAAMGWLNGCARGQASPPQEAPGNVANKPGVAGTIRATADEVRRGPLTVAVSEEAADPLDCGFTGDARVLNVRYGARPVDSVSFCSAYGVSRVRHVIDTLGDHYFLLVHGEGHGTNATSEYLTVYRLGGTVLDERARWLIREGAGPTALSSYAYSVTTPPGGGIVVSGRWSLEGEPVTDDPWRSRRRMVVAVDTRQPSP